MLSVGHQIDIVNRLILGRVWHIAHFNAAQVFDPAHALHTGHHKAQRVALLGPQHLAVLAISHQHLARGNQLDGNRARHRRAIRAFGQNEFAFFEISPGHLQQGNQGHAGELAARQHAMRVLHRGHGDIAPLHASVGSTFDKVKARHCGQPHDLVHGEDLGVLHQTVDHESMFGRIDIPPALMVALKMQATGRDDAKQRLQWSKRNRGLLGLRQTRALATLHIGFVF